MAELVGTLSSWDCPSILQSTVQLTQLDSLHGPLPVRKWYCDYLSIGVLQAQTWPSVRVLYNFDKTHVNTRIGTCW